MPAPHTNRLVHHEASNEQDPQMDDVLSSWPSASAWLADVLGPEAGVPAARALVLRDVGVICRGRVMFLDQARGWEGIQTDHAPRDVWVHFSVIEAEGYRSLEEGDEVELRWEPAMQDSWRCRATWVRRVAR